MHFVFILGATTRSRVMFSRAMRCLLLLDAYTYIIIMYFWMAIHMLSLYVIGFLCVHAGLFLGCIYCIICLFEGHLPGVMCRWVVPYAVWYWWMAVRMLLLYIAGVFCKDAWLFFGCIYCISFLWKGHLSGVVCCWVVIFTVFLVNIYLHIYISIYYIYTYEYMIKETVIRRIYDMYFSSQKRSYGVTWKRKCTWEVIRLYTVILLYVYVDAAVCRYACL